MTKPVIGFHKVLLVRGWSLRVEQDWTCKFAEMTLKRSGNFIDLRERIRSATACRLYLFSFSDETEQRGLNQRRGPHPRRASSNRKRTGRNRLYAPVVFPALRSVQLTGPPRKQPLRTLPR